MSDDIIIRAEGVSKKYQLGIRAAEEGYETFRDMMARNIASVIRRPGRADSQRPRGRTIVSELWALKDVEFEIARGDVVGIVGRNGAGKSTLLKILSRITEPTEGRISIKGRMASLLEVGTGFHPELTGRENIYLNGAILGMGRQEIRGKFDEIVSFADIERFLETPVKRYSSGMYMRLAFSVAAHLHSDILVVDEVLAVGDAEFQKKCLGRMAEFSTSGRTVLFVSHNIGALVATCKSGLLLQSGRVMMSDTINAVAQEYHSRTSQSGNLLTVGAFSGPLQGVEFLTLEINGEAEVSQPLVRPDQPLSFDISGHTERPVPNFRFAFALFREGIRLFTLHDELATLKEGSFRLNITLPAKFLRPGNYAIALGGARVDGDEWIWSNDIATVTIMEGWSEDFTREDQGIVNRPGTIVRSIA